MQHSKRGFAMLTVLMMLVVLMALLSAYFLLTKVELTTSKASATSIQGFYAAEGGLNLRAEEIRAKFVGYNRPSGTEPDTSSGGTACDGSHEGTGDFACKTYALGGQRVVTYVVPDQPGGSPGETISIPPGDDRFAGLSAIQYKYSVYSVAYDRADDPTAIVQMDFLSRLVPLFQFAAFYENDLEINPSPVMTLSGPVHTNANLYLNPYNDLTIKGQITTAGGVFRGLSPDDENGHAECPASGSVYVDDGAGRPTELSGCPKEYTEADVGSWGNQIKPHSGELTIPDVSVLNPQPGNDFFDQADLRLMVSLAGTPPTASFELWKPDGTLDGAATTAIQSCTDPHVNSTGSMLVPATAVSVSDQFYNNREGKQITMVDVNVRAMLDCIYDNRVSLGFNVDDDTQGGLVWYVGVDEPDAGNSCDATTSPPCTNDYGVRLLNGADLASTRAGAPAVKGLTVITNQASYVQGDYNKGDTAGKKPAAVISDAMNILSAAWSDTNSGDGANPGATSTTVNAAFLSGTDVSDGSPGDYSGGLENYPRFHENWSGRTFTYRGSFVSLGKPLHSQGRWTDQVYSAPNRDFDFDTDFRDVANLPPLSPRFVYLKQLLFARQFSQ